VRPTVAFARPKPLHVAVIAPPWMELPPTGYGGIEAMCADLVAALLRGGHRVTLVGAGHNGTGATFVRTYDRPQGERLGQAVPEVVHAAALPAILSDLDVDVVHDHTFAGPLLAAAHGLPTVVTAHGPVGGEIGGYYRNISRWVHLVAISDAQRTCAPDIPWCGTVHNALEPAAYSMSTHKEEYALFLGRMCPEKGVVTAIRTARAAGVPLVIAAKCREAAERRYFDEVVAPLLGEDTRWVGEVGGAAKSDLLGRARCLLFPIDWEEPFGMVMIEAMACGTPVVATARGSVSEIVRHGKTGFVCADERALVAAVRAARAIDPARCRAEVEARFSVDRMAAGYASIYRQVVSSPDPVADSEPTAPPSTGRGLQRAHRLVDARSECQIQLRHGVDGSGPRDEPHAAVDPLGADVVVDVLFRPVDPPAERFDPLLR
jgi:glycosyltransferase involved in cell wall biosynthesis